MVIKTFAIPKFFFQYKYLPLISIPYWDLYFPIKIHSCYVSFRKVFIVMLQILTREFAVITFPKQIRNLLVNFTNLY